MSEKEVYELLLDKAGGDAHAALLLAVKWVAVSGLCMSAGFVRVSPYETVSPPKQKPESLDA